MCGTLLQDRERQGCRDRAHMDVLVASPVARYRATSAPMLIKRVGACVANHVRGMGLGVSGTAVADPLFLILISFLSHPFEGCHG